MKSEGGAETVLKISDRDFPPVDERINRFSILSYTLSTNMGFRKGILQTLLHFRFGRLTNLHTRKTHLVNHNRRLTNSYCKT
jgi:hypothetical protein